MRIPPNLIFSLKNFAILPAETSFSRLSVGFSPLSAHAVIKITMVKAKVKPFKNRIKYCVFPRIYDKWSLTRNLKSIRGKEA